MKKYINTIPLIKHKFSIIFKVILEEIIKEKSFNNFIKDMSLGKIKSLEVEIIKRHYGIKKDDQPLYCVNYLAGGLGNQLYYLAYADFLRSKNLPISMIIQYNNNKGDTTDKTKRNLITELPRILEFNIYHIFNSLTLEIVARKFGSNFRKIKQLTNEFAVFKHFESESLHGKSVVFFEGYFQSYHYISASFKENLQKILPTLTSTNQKFVIKPQDVAVHIRRGDFLQHELFEFIDINYYLAALATFDNINRIYLFSDDFSGIQSEIEALSTKYKIVCVKNQTVLEDMCLLMQFSRYVVGNSTFAWWGCMLSLDKNAHVCVPQYPFNPIMVDYRKLSMYPPEWHLIENKKIDTTTKKVAILYICTGRYTIFWDGFYQSAENYLLTNLEKHYFIFTDTNKTLVGEDKNATKIFQEKLGWPFDTLMRFEMFLKIKEQLLGFDYVFFFNANMKFVGEVTPLDILPLKPHENLTVFLHPGFYDKPRQKFTYDRNSKSLAYIPMDEGKYYFMGSLNGGKTVNYLEMCEKLNNRIKQDLSKDVIALWHDESHLNRYMVNRDDLKILSPKFGYPEGWILPFKAKIIIQDKSHPRFGGHEYLRSSVE